MPAVSLVSFVVKLLFDHQGHNGHNGKNQRVDLQVSSAVFQRQAAFSTTCRMALKACFRGLQKMLKQNSTFLTVDLLTCVTCDVPTHQLLDLLTREWVTVD